MINDKILNGSIKLIDNKYASIYLHQLRDIKDDIHVIKIFLFNIYVYHKNNKFVLIYFRL